MSIGHPELLVFGLPDELAGMVFNRVYAKLKDGIRTGHEDLIENVLSVPLLIHKADDSLAYPRTIQGQVYYSVRGIKPVYKQVIWPDTAGVYPHQQGFAPQMKPIQPYQPGAKSPFFQVGDESAIAKR